MKRPFSGWTAAPDCDHPSVLYLAWLLSTLGARVERCTAVEPTARALALTIARQALPPAPWTLRLSDGTATYTVSFTGIDRPEWETCSDAAAWGWGGLSGMTGEAGGPPLAPGAPLASMVAALHGLLALAAAEHARLATAELSIALGDVVASLIEVAGLRYQAQGLLRGRAGDWWGQAGWGVYDCADGRVAIALRDIEQLHHAAEVIDQPALRDERFADFTWGNCAALDEANALLAVGLAGRTADEAVAGLRRGRIAAAPVRGLGALLADPHLCARAAFSDADGLMLPASPFRSLGGSSADARFDGAATAETRPLSGVRVLDISSVWAGPMAARLLADLGAEVTKVVPPVRSVGGWSTGHAWDRDFYAILNDRNKRVFSADLAAPLERERFVEHARQADVLIENFVPGSLNRLGLGHGDLHAVNPRLIVVAMPAFGLTGPDSGAVGYGSTIEQAAGIGCLYADAEGVPHRSGINFSDPIAAVCAAAAAVLALDGPRNRRVVDISQQEAALSLMLPALATFQVEGVVPHAAEATRSGTGWAFAAKPGDSSLVPVRDVPEVIGEPGAPGSRTVRWLRHPDEREYPLVGLPWTGAFSAAVSPAPVPLPLPLLR
ncbi:MAG: CoA transferase [Dehalococcoidia bacterium]